jgi:hypothetical protein
MIDQSAPQLRFTTLSHGKGKFDSWHLNIFHTPTNNGSSNSSQRLGTLRRIWESGHTYHVDHQGHITRYMLEVLERKIGKTQRATWSTAEIPTRALPEYKQNCGTQIREQKVLGITCDYIPQRGGTSLNTQYQPIDLHNSLNTNMSLDD